MIRGAIFDLDGVLLDSMGIWEDLGARYLRQLHIPPEPGLNEILFSMSMEQGAVYLKAHYPLQQSEAEICGGIAQMLKDYYAPSPARRRCWHFWRNGAFPWRRLPPARGRT